MRWTFDFIFGRIYFWGGLGIITYTFFSIAFGLPNLAAGAPVWLTSMLMGLVLMLVGLLVLTEAYAKISKRKPEAKE